MNYSPLVVLSLLYVERPGTYTDLRADWVSPATRCRRIYTAEEISRKTPSVVKNDTARLAGVPSEIMADGKKLRINPAKSIHSAATRESGPECLD